MAAPVSELREILQAAPREKLESWCRLWEVPGGERLPGLARALVDPARVAVHVAGVSESARRLLRRLVAEGFVSEKPATRLAAKALAEIPLAIPSRSPSGGRGIFLPNEMQEPLRAAFRSADAKSAACAPPAAPPATRADATLREAMFLAEYAALHGIPLTQAGAIAKKDVARFAALLAVPMSEAELARRIDLAETLGLVARGEKGLASGSARGAFAHVAPRVQARAFARWVFARGGAATRDLFRLLADAEGWCDRARLVALRDAKDPLAALEEAGFVEEAEGAVRLSAWGRLAAGGRPGKAVRRLTLLPNGQILAPRDLAPDLAARLFVWAERRKVDAVEEWEVTRESVARALARGLRSTELTDFLREAAGEVPPSLVSAVAEWEAGATRFRTFIGSTLLARDPADRAWVSERLRAADLLVEEALPGAFLLHPAADEEIRAALGGETAVRVEPREEEDESGLEETERRLAVLEEVPRRGTFRAVFSK